MKINKGLFRDMSLEEQPNSTWVGGKNLVYSNKYNELHNEPGFSKIIDNTEQIVIGIIPTSIDFVIFSVYERGVNFNSEIGVYRNGAYIKILGADLNFNINYPIFGEYYYNYNNELIVTWSDNYNKPKILNIDNLPVDVDGNKDIVSQEEVHHLDMFSSFKSPYYILEDVVESGGSLKSGAYYITIQYELPDGSYGNFLNVSNPITIYADSSSLTYHLIGGSDDGDDTSKAIKIRIGNIDTRYKKFRFGIIYKTKTAVESYVTNSYSITEFVNSFYIPSLLGLSSINLQDIIVRNTYYDKIGAMTSIDNILWIANLQVAPELKYQKYANNIEVKYVFDTQVALNGFKGSYKDPVFLFDRKSFMPGEVYALYIRFRYKGGNKVTQAFHIPGRDIVGNNDIAEGDFIARTVDPQALNFHFNDTCDADGLMSYWHNINERYPNDEEFDGRFDYEGNAINNGRDLRQSLVKHHKFPTSRYLNNNFGLINPTSNALTTVTSLTSPFSFNIYNNYHKKVGFNEYSFNKGYVSNNNTVFKNITLDVLNVQIVLGISGTASFTKIDNMGGVNYLIGHVKCNILKNNSEVLESGISYTASGNIQYEYTITLSTTLQPNEFINFNIDAYSEDVESNTLLFINPNSLILLNLLNLELSQYDGNLAGRVLGIKLENIYIPDYIAKDCDSFEILYAKRDNDNQTVLSQGMFSNKLNTYNDIYNDTYTRYYDFDLSSLHKSFKATHLQADGYLNSNRFIETIDTITGYTNATKYAKIINSQYLLNNSKYEIVDNMFREGSIYIQLPSDSNLEYKTNTTVSLSHDTLIYGVKNILLATLCSFKTDMYLNYTNKTLINTGRVYPIVASNYITDAVVYGGDVVFTYNGVTRHFKYKGDDTSYNNDDMAIVYNLVPSYNILNSGLRYKGKELNEVFYPYFNFINNRKGLGSQAGKVNNAENSYFEMLNLKYGYEILAQMPEYYSNNLTYSITNDIEPTLIYNYKNKFNDKFPFRLHKSLKQFEESKVINWRTFKPAEYYESVANRGDIYALTNDGNDLLILHFFSLFVVRNITSLNISDNIVSSLGNSELFQTKPIEIMHNGVGYVGCQSKFGIVKFKYGVLIIDRYAKKMFIYNNLKVDEITIYGVNELMHNILPYPTEILETYNYYFDDGNVIQFEDGAPIEYREATLEDKFLIDNPFTQFGIHATWDDLHSRLLITNVNPESTEMSDNSYTISYYPEIKTWGFFHDYIPKFSFYNRSGVFFINGDGKIYKGNNQFKHNLYTGEYKDLYIDVVFNQPFHLDKLFQSLEWATFMSIDGVEKRDLTFDKIIIFNGNRYTGELNIISDTTSNNFNTRNINGVWRFNELRDILLNKSFKVLDTSKIDILNKPTDSNDIASNWYDKNLIIDKYIVVRLILNAKDISLDESVRKFKLYDITASSNIIKR